MPRLPSVRSILRSAIALARHRPYWAAALIVLATPVAWLVAHEAAPPESALVARVKRGEFKVTVTTSGELKARQSVEIRVPDGMQQAQVYQTTIASIIPEGTVVKAGDVVANLDRSQIAAKASEVSLALQKAEAVYEQAMLDSTLNLSKAREDIKTMEFGLEEKRLAKEQAVYEAPTVKRQAEIDYEKAQRALDQAKQDYETKVEQAKAKMREVGADVQRQRNQLGVIQGVMQGFTVKAPAPGMVIYSREWNGRKRTTGSQVSAWDATVATLPDLTQMESVTYVNEIDVRKVAVGQPAQVTLDADPTKKLTGKVTHVANVGEQRPNTDAKVFEVHVVVDQSDTTLRPGMTTGNRIETAKIADALHLPLEALNSEAGVPFVYLQTRGGAKKQEVATGAMNDDEVVITRGLDEGDRVLLTPPADHDRLSLSRLKGAPAAEPQRPVAGGDTALRSTVPADTTSRKRPN
jgi:RND family efflux transporter MFP subunit